MESSDSENSDESTDSDYMNRVELGYFDMHTKVELDAAEEAILWEHNDNADQDVLNP